MFHAVAAFTCGAIISSLIASVVWSYNEVPNTHPKHFVLINTDELDPNELRSMLTGKHIDFENCDIYDLSNFPTNSIDETMVTRDQALTSLITLRDASNNWVRHNKFVVILPPQATDCVQVYLAQMRAVGLLAVVVVPTVQEAEQVCKLSPNFDRAVQKLPL
jgi:hypothetical protein